MFIASFMGSLPMFACTVLSPVKSSGLACTCSRTTSFMRANIPMSALMSIRICKGQRNPLMLQSHPSHHLIFASRSFAKDLLSLKLSPRRGTAALPHNWCDKGIASRCALMLPSAVPM